MIKCIRSSRLSIKNSLSLDFGAEVDLRMVAHPSGCARCGAGAVGSAIRYRSLFPDSPPHTGLGESEGDRKWGWGGGGGGRKRDT